MTNDEARIPNVVAQAFLPVRIRAQTRMSVPPDALILWSWVLVIGHSLVIGNWSLVILLSRVA
jgi:hypothetical protein